MTKEQEVGLDGRSYLILPMGEIKEVKPKDMYFTEQEVKELLVCDVIEIAQSKYDDFFILFDEEFRSKSDWWSNLNIKATQLLNQSYRPFQVNFIGLNALLIHKNYIK